MNSPRLGSNWWTEILAGVTTFVTTAYIIFVNPSTLGETGIPFAAVTAATCLSATLGFFLMGGIGRYPLALALGNGVERLVRLRCCKRFGSAFGKPRWARLSCRAYCS